jgi:hypothetical protein
VRPRPEQYATRAEYRWARRQWNRRHGGSLPGTLAVAVLFGAATGSTVLFFALVAFAVLATAFARKPDQRRER